MLTKQMTKLQHRPIKLKPGEPPQLMHIMNLFVYLASFLLFLLMVTRLVRKSKHVKLPPGPRPLPIIGNMHQLHGPLPHRVITDLAKNYGPVMLLKLGAVPTVVISSAEAAKEVTKDHDMIFASRPPLLFSTILNYNNQGLAFTSYNDAWRQLRKICSVEVLNARRVQSFRPIREEEVMNMIKSISSQRGSAINFSRMIYSLTYTIISRCAFGKRSKYVDQYIKLNEEAMKLMGGFSIVDLYPSIKILETITGIRKKFQKIHEQVDEVLETIISEHKQKSGEPDTGNGGVKEDLVDVLLNIQKSGAYGGSLTHDNIKGAIYDIFSGGGQTSSRSLMWSMREIMRNPAMLKRAQDEVRQVVGAKGNVDESDISELKYLRVVLKETLRLHPSAPLAVPRESSEECEVGGYVIPAKTRVLINVFAISRDPKHWTDPETFNPDRFLECDIDFKGKDMRYIPFGAGRRICPGIPLAMNNMELPLAQMLYHFDWKLPGEMKPEDLDMTEAYGLTVGPKDDLILVPSIYHLSNLA